MINHPDTDLADPAWNTSGVPWFTPNAASLKRIYPYPKNNHNTFKPCTSGRVTLPHPVLPTIIWKSGLVFCVCRRTFYGVNL